MEDLTLEIPPSGDERDQQLRKEWLLTNGLGGYASGTLGGVPSRRYHGLLISALPAPLGRWMMLNHLEVTAQLPHGKSLSLGGRGWSEKGPEEEGAGLKEFRLELGLPVWRYEVGEVALERRLVLPHRQNTVFLCYRLLKGGPVSLSLRPWVHFRPHGSPVARVEHPDYTWKDSKEGQELSCGQESVPPLRLKVYATSAPFTRSPQEREDLIYPREEERGYAWKGGLWSPGEYRVELSAGQDVTLVASTETWEVVLALGPEVPFDAERRRRQELLAAARDAARRGPASLLVLAADQFLIKPAGRVRDEVRSHAVGDEVQTVIAGYYWFCDWGRDTMISLEGLTLVTGRHVEAGYILRTFAQYVRDGLIPNRFPEGEREGRYNTADATLWYFHALDRYLACTKDKWTLGCLLPSLRDIIEHQLRGTRYGIGVDPKDGLLHEGTPDEPLTWMDAKVGDWVVTPRRGKPVEINALWYNALRLMEGWLREHKEEGEADRMAQLARKARSSFNKRFWYEEGGYLYDVIDGPEGDDSSLRPNQVLALSLRYPVLRREYWRRVLDIVWEKLWTPRGLRSLAPGSPNYKPQYFGDRRSRDAAYHQGTVWPWLVGPFVDAWLRVHKGDRATARKFLEGILENLKEDCVGSINEVFDAEEPFTPRGCIAQAWSVAEALRAWVKTSG